MALSNNKIELRTVVLRFFPTKEEQEIAREVLEQEKEKGTISQNAFSMLMKCLEL